MSAFLRNGSGVEAVKGGDSPISASTSEKYFAEGKQDTSTIRQKIRLCWKVALWNFEIHSFPYGVKISIQEATQSMPKSTL